MVVFIFNTQFWSEHMSFFKSHVFFQNGTMAIFRNILDQSWTLKFHKAKLLKCKTFRNICIKLTNKYWRTSFPTLSLLNCFDLWMPIQKNLRVIYCQNCDWWVKLGLLHFVAHYVHFECSLPPCFAWELIILWLKGM